MAYPKQSEIELPLLRVIAELGGEAKTRDTYPKVAQYFPELTEDDVKRKVENYPSTNKWHNKVQWARQALINKGQLDGSIRGLWKITAQGMARIEADDTVCESVHSGAGDNIASTDVTLSDLLDSNIEAVKKRIIDELKTLTYDSFEKFCKLLLETLGYDNVEVTKKGGDGGIDGYGDFKQGVVHIKSAFQAKRWDSGTVGRPEIDKFRGAIQGDYDHGVFLTTSRFSRDAEQASVKKGAITILMLDGDAIAGLMIEKGIGVDKQPAYILDIDHSFFDFDE